MQNVEPILNNYATMQTEDIDLDLLLLVDGGNDVDNWGNLALQGKVGKFGTTVQWGNLRILDCTKCRFFCFI